MVRQRIAYAGVPGAFAEIACHTFRPDHDPFGRPGFAEAIAAVETGQADMAAIPTRNTVAGLVPGVADLLDRPVGWRHCRCCFPCRSSLLSLS